jgi:hypothetical protein
MKLTPRRTKMLMFMSGTGGRIVRGSLSLILAVIALTQLGWYLLLLPLAAFMAYTAIMNFCPATLAFPDFKREAVALKGIPEYRVK